MQPDRIENALKGFLQNPARCYPKKIPAIINYKNYFNFLNNIREGIAIKLNDVEYETFESGSSANFKTYLYDLIFFTRNIGKTRPFVENQRNINSFFNKARNNKFTVAQLVKLNSSNNNWELENVRNELDNYSIYGSNNHPELSESINYYGYKVRDVHNANDIHFLYRIPRTLLSKVSGWFVLDLNSHISFPVSRFKGNFAEVHHGGDTYFYEFVKTKIFDGSQYINLLNSTFEIEQVEIEDIGDVLEGTITLQIRDYSQDVCPEEEEVFESVVAPSHPYSPIVYNDKLLISAVGDTNMFTTTSWMNGTRVKNTLEVTPPTISDGDYLGFAYSHSQLDGIQEKDNVFGNIFAAFKDAGIHTLGGINYYTYISKNTYYANSNPRPYVVSEDDSFVDSVIIAYHISPNAPSINDFHFTGPEFIDPTKNHHDISISANNAYVAIAFSGGNLLRIMDGNTNIRNEFLPNIDQQFQQRIFNNRIYNIFYSKITFDTITSWTLYF